MSTLITALLIIILVPACFSFLWFLKEKEEKKKPHNSDCIRTYPPKALTVLFLGFGIFMVLAGIAAVISIYVTDRENTTMQQYIIIVICFTVLACIGFLGYIILRFNYVVTDANGVHVYRLFRKKKYYRYEEIGCFLNKLEMGIAGGLICYDKNNKKIFSIEAVHIGSSDVAQQLRSHGVSEKYL